MATATATIDLNAIRHNWQKLRSMSSKDTGAVVKANAYGLGLKQVAKALYDEGARLFFVATAEEGAELRSSLGKTIEIYVFSGHMVGDTELIRNYNLIPLINSIEQLSRHSQLLKEKKFGVQLDTGMNRLGMEEVEFTSLGKNISNACLIMSHLACADEPSHTQNLQQLKTFHHLTDDLNIRRSLSATGGILLGPDYHFDLCRPGIGLYGGLPFEHSKPVVKLSIPVIQSRRVLAGETVGYGGNWVAKSETQVATISAGYADGLIRAIGNGQILLYDGEIGCPLIGRVSMDLITVDITQLGYIPKTLDLINKVQTIDTIAHAANTIGYEILTSLGARYNREYISG